MRLSRGPVRKVGLFAEAEAGVTGLPFAEDRVLASVLTDKDWRDELRNVCKSAYEERAEPLRERCGSYAFS